MDNHKERFETERLIIRKLEYSDDVHIFSTYASKQLSTRYISWPTHKSLEDTREFLKKKIKSWENGPDYPYAIVDKRTNDFIGSIGFANESGRVFIGYIINPAKEGRGNASEAAKCIVDYLVSLNQYYRIWACCAVENESSSKVLEKAGMVREGLVHDWAYFPNLGKSLDCYFYYVPIPARG